MDWKLVGRLSLLAPAVLLLLSACGETTPPRYTAAQVIEEARMASPACRGAIIGEGYG